MLKEPFLGLFLNMGLGKTVITLTALNEMLFYQKSVNKVLVIAPKRVAQTTWSDEKDKWDHLKHLKISKILGNEKERLNGALKQADIYIINRENVKWLVERFKSNWIWDTVVIDELSSFKNPKSVRFKKLKTMLPHIRRLYGLTGTPASNGLIDLWSQMFLIDKGIRLGKTLGAYRTKYFLPDKRNRNIIYTYKLKDGAEANIRDKISDICISIKNSEYVKLPEKIVVDRAVMLSKESKDKYLEMEKDMILSLPDGEITASSAAVVTNKLLQVASGEIYDEDGEIHFIHDEKIETLKELIEEAQGEPVLVFYQFKHEKDRILNAFSEAKELIDESTIKEWNKGNIKILLTHPASSAYGLNIQHGGHRIIWFSPTWNLEQYEQSNARLHRQGQSEPVIITRMLCEDTVDKIVVDALKNKNAVQERLLNSIAKLQKEYEVGGLESS